MERNEAFLQLMMDAMREDQLLMTDRHSQTMAEIAAMHEDIRDLILLQKEHRIDIMPLFQAKDHWAS